MSGEDPLLLQYIEEERSLACVTIHAPGAFPAANGLFRRRERCERLVRKSPPQRDLHHLRRRRVRTPGM